MATEPGRPFADALANAELRQDYWARLMRAIRWRISHTSRVLVVRSAGRHFDNQIELGIRLPPDSTLAVHAARITSNQERALLARTLRSLANSEHSQITARVPANRRAIAESAPLIDEIALRLHAPLPVNPRGMARLRLLLSDGGGPLYQPGRGTLRAELRGVLAAL